MQRHRFPAMAWALRCWHSIVGSKKPSSDIPPFPYRQFIILGTRSAHILEGPKLTFTSSGPHLRAYCFHVRLSICLLHG
jgi:hypothetical protein